MADLLDENAFPLDEESVPSTQMGCKDLGNELLE